MRAAYEKFARGSYCPSPESFLMVCTASMRPMRAATAARRRRESCSCVFAAMYAYLSTMMPARIAFATDLNLGLSSERRFCVVLFFVNVVASHCLTYTHHAYIARDHRKCA